jgi:hypothetical protein
VSGLEFTTVPGKLSVKRQVSQVGIHGQQISNYQDSLSSCNISFTGIQDAQANVPTFYFFFFVFFTKLNINVNNNKVVTDVIVRPVTWAPTCTEEGFANVTQQLDDMSRLFDSASSANDFNEVVFLANGYVASDNWFACYTLADTQYVHVSAQEIVTEVTLRCTSTDPAYNSSTDPCCNF